MPIISTTGRRYWRVRLLIWSMYFALVAGSITMLYPFGMMLSMSACGFNDNMEQQLIPRYVKEKVTGAAPDALFRQYASMRMSIEDFNRRHRSRYVDFSYGLPGQPVTGVFARFQRIRPIPYDLDDPRFKRVVDDVNAFKTWYTTGKDPQGVMPDTRGHMVDMMVAFRTRRSNFTLNPVLDRYVDWLKARYNGSLKDVNEAYHEENEYWSDVLMPYEQPHLVTWLPDTRSRKVREFLEFKKDLAAENVNFFLFPDLNYHTLFMREYNSEEQYRRQTGRSINSFYEIKVPPRAPALTVPHDLLRAFLQNTYGSVDKVNNVFSTTFNAFEDVIFPTPDSAHEPSLRPLAAFILYVFEQKADVSFQNYLKAKYTDETAFHTRHGIELPSIPSIHLPQHVSADFGITDQLLRKALLVEMVEFAYAEFCVKERDLWIEFVTRNCPVRCLIVDNADVKYRAFLRKKYENSIEKLLSYYRQGLSTEDAARFQYASFDDVKFPGDIALTDPDGTYFFHRPITDDVLEFVASDAIDPVADVTVATAEYWWGRYLEKKYGGVEGANEAHSQKFGSWNNVNLTRETPRIYSKALQEAWGEFVCEVLPVTSVGMSLGNLRLFRSFLDMRYRGDIAALNSAYSTSYKRFSQVELPDDPQNAAMVADVSAFLKYDWTSPYDLFIKGDLPQEQFREFLRQKYGTVENLNAACRTYSDLDAPPLPYDELEWADFNRQWVQKGFFWQALLGNYRVVLDFLTLHGRALFNTFVFCLASILVHTTVNPMCAYALSRFKLPYAHYVLLFLLATMAFPPMVTMIPNFLMLKGLGLLNTYWALILPGMANGYSIFLLKGFFDSLPQELFEAGIIDGATEVQMFYRLAMPLSYPILAVIALWSFTGAYGAFMFAFIVCQDPRLWTLMVFLYEFQQEHSTQLTMAALTLASIPTLLIFVLAQRVILKGVVIPQMK